MSQDSDFELKQHSNLTQEERLRIIESTLFKGGHFATSLGSYRDDVDFNKMFKFIWLKRFHILLITIVFTLVSGFYAVSLPNVYKATAVLAPASQNSKDGLGGLASQYGSLAAIAGINLNSATGENKIEHAVQMLKSWPYIESFLIKNDLKSTFVATKGWYSESDQLEFDSEIFDNEQQVWLKDNGKTLEPSSYETFEQFKKLLSVNIDKETGLINLSVEHFSPYVAMNTVNLLKLDINEYFKSLDREEAEKSIALLSKKVSETNNNEILQAFYNMIEAQTKTLIMVEVKEEYLMKTLVPAMLPEKKAGPKRGLIVTLSTIFGFVIAVLFFLVKTFLKIKFLESKK